MIYSEWLHEWLKDRKNYIKESTYANYGTLIHLYIVPAMGGLQVSDIDEQLVQQKVLHWVHANGLSCSTVRNVVMVIKSSLRAAQKNKLAPMQIIDVSYPKTYKETSRKVLSKSDQSKLVQYAYLNLTSKSAGILLALSTGMRIGELCGLRWSDIDFSNQTISVQRTVQRICSPDGKSRTKIIISEPKTISSRRTVPLSTSILPVLHKLNMSNDGYILTNHDRPIEPRMYREYFNSLLRKTGVNHVNFHSLRHTFATRLIENGADYKTVSTILGHSSINMTLNLYVHPQLSHQRNAIELFSLLV